MMPTVVTTGAGEVKGTYECGGRGRHQLKIWCWRWVIDREHSKLKGWANEGGRGVVKAVKWLPLPVTHLSVVLSDNMHARVCDGRSEKSLLL